jgi:Transposase DDE domain
MERAVERDHVADFKQAFYNEAIKEGETPEDWKSKPAKNRQKDKDARWTKNERSYFGHKNHIGVDRRHKLVRRYVVSDASVHDSQKFEDVLDTSNTASEAQKAANTTRSKVRARVFGDQKNGMGAGIVRTIGIVRARCKIGMTNLAYNIRRFVCLERMAAAAVSRAFSQTVPEPDGPFTHVDRRPTWPGDVRLAIDGLAQIFGRPADDIALTIRRNLKTALTEAAKVIDGLFDGLADGVWSRPKKDRHAGGLPDGIFFRA